MYTVDYMYENELHRNSFTFDYEAKHFAIDIAYDNAKDILICEFGKIIGRIDSYSKCYFFARV